MLLKRWKQPINICKCTSLGSVDQINHAILIHFRDVDKVHDMMDDIAEQQEVAREISEAISNPVAFGQDIDEVTFSKFLIYFFNIRASFLIYIFCI